jgi:SNF2 family DNA or RNA helicase
MKTDPFQHQTECLTQMRDRASFAVLMEQGLGKTKTILDDAEILFNEKKISALFVVAPNGVHSNWVENEIPKHLDAGSEILEYSSNRRSTAKFRKAADLLFKKDFGKRRLRILAMNVEALSSGGAAADLARRFLAAFPCMMVVDESSRIKTPSSARTKRVIALGKHAPYKRICTGTAVTQSPFDLYSQFFFLDPGILGFYSYYAFRHRYGVWQRRVASQNGRRWDYEDLMKYVDLDDLWRRISPHSYRRTKAECLDLPKKIYKIAYVELTPLQKNLMSRVLEHGVLEFDDFSELTPLQITRLLRAQQIIGGFMPESSKPLPGKNPRIDALLETVEDHPGKVVVWARFRAEISAIVFALREAYGYGAIVEFHGGVTAKGKMINAEKFQNDPSTRFLVGQQQSGMGVTLHAAETVVYYSNSFSYEQRYQSEDRAHRIGLRHPVLYIDLIARDTVDERIREVLRKARKIAGKILDEQRGRP